MRFAIAGEGRTDFIVLQNLLIGFFNDKNLAVTRLLPKDKEPVGWGNVLNYLSTEEFRIGALYNDYVVVKLTQTNVKNGTKACKILEIIFPW